MFRYGASYGWGTRIVVTHMQDLTPPENVILVHKGRVSGCPLSA